MDHLAGLRLPSPVERLDDDRLRSQGVELWLKRDDLIHPDVPGSKWRKLRYNLEAASEQGQQTLLTFGGAYSSHLRATAAAGRHCGFATVGIVRGEQHLPLNPSLACAERDGMRLRYLDRQAYRRKREPDAIAALRREYGPFYLLPEGGSNELAARGCAELAAEIEPDFDVICCPCGTGATLAGIAAGLRPGQQAIGFPVLKGGEFLAAQVADLQDSAFGARSGNWRLECRFHFGGYARRNAVLDNFMAGFLARHGVALDWVYVAKMMYGIWALADEGAFRPGTRVVAVVTGSPGPQ
jgi:1-aminocyclopropane-1-carboxylate deaminase